uniref:Uncharacterized protein n=1 Tax=Kalanchoe fedtschenkoi TaxID=63787 RepID=A0A7N0VIR3_KALFE
MDEEGSPQPQQAAEVEEHEPDAIMEESNATPSRRFDPSRMIGIIRRKALIKKLAAAYHVECLACCQELLELQKNTEEPVFDYKEPEDEMRKERQKPPKRSKKGR